MKKLEQVYKRPFYYESAIQKYVRKHFTLGNGMVDNEVILKNKKYY